MTMPPLPPPDLEGHETERWGQNVCDDYWRLAKVKAYGAACAAAYKADAERYRCLRATTSFVTNKGERIDVRNNPELWDSTIDAYIQKRARGEA